MRNTFIALALALAAATGIAQAADKISQIRDQQNRIRLELQAGTVPVTPRVAALLKKDQAVVFSILDRNPTLEAMNVQERVDLDNALERINANLQGSLKAGADKDVCKYERVSGSKEKQLVCGTQDARDDARTRARAFMEKPRVCAPPCSR